jgi:hypothetical protein
LNQQTGKYNKSAEYLTTEKTRFEVSKMMYEPFDGKEWLARRKCAKELDSSGYYNTKKQHPNDFTLSKTTLQRTKDISNPALERYHIFTFQRLCQNRKSSRLSRFEVVMARRQRNPKNRKPRY